MNLDRDLLIKAQFVDKASGKPITGEKYWVKVMDKDFLKDDFIDAPKLDEEGKIAVLTTRRVVKEANPDIYFILHMDDKVIYKSKVFKNSRFDDGDDNSTAPLEKDFGVFKV